MDIKTVKGLRYAIRKCDAVYIQPRFGCSESYVRISKTEANRLADSLSNCTPEQVEMYSGSFGHVDESNDLYLG